MNLCWARSFHDNKSKGLVGSGKLNVSSLAQSTMIIHDYSVHIDRNATWIKYSTSRKLYCIDGIADTHYKLRPADDSDPYMFIWRKILPSHYKILYNVISSWRWSTKLWLTQSTVTLQAHYHWYQIRHCEVPHVLTMGSLLLAALVDTFLGRKLPPWGLLYMKNWPLILLKKFGKKESRT